MAGIVAGIATFGAVNNLTNAIYYNYFSDGESDLTPNSYNSRYINRWDRLDYVKRQESMPDTYGSTAWLYYSEYNLHMHAWYLSGWAIDKDVFMFSYVAERAERAENAEVLVGEWDERWYINIFIVPIGLLGV